jgi:hypothetical protein
MTFTVQNTGGGTLAGSAHAYSEPFSIVSGSPYSLTVGQMQVVTVRFAPMSVQVYNQEVMFSGANGAITMVTGTGSNILSLSKTGSGSVKVNSVLQSLPWSGSFALGAVVTIEAIADTGYGFANWSGDLTGSTNPTSVTMDGPRNVVTNFTIHNAYSGGMGTQDEPYQISTVADWQALIATPSDWDKHFVLTADINMQNISLNPIGNFTGTFGGNGHVIRNVIINGGGLFDDVGASGQIHDLGVEGVSINGGGYVGGLVGMLQGTLTACYVTGSVSGTGWNTCTGGLVGLIDSAGTVVACYASDSVCGGTGHYALVGGLAGYNGGSVTACYATGSVSGGTDTAGVGGLVGFNPGTLTSCYAVGRVTCDYPTLVGGLVGANGGTVTACFWDVASSGRASSWGGEGKRTVEMKTLSTFTNAGWDFYTPIWMIIGQDYPRLIWNDSDIDGNGKVDFVDFSLLASRWMEMNCGFCDKSDLTGDRRVDMNDLLVFAAHWLESANALDPHLVGYWEFDEGSGTIASDSSGHGNTGTLRNHTSWSGGALCFDGVDDWVEVSDSDTLDITSQITLSAWVHFDSSPTKWTKIVIKPYQNYDDPWDLYCLDFGPKPGSSTYSVPRFELTDGVPAGGSGSGYGEACDANFELPVGSWHHVVGTYDGSVMVLYVDGGPIASSPASLQIGTNNMPLSIGGRLGTDDGFNGCVDDVRIYNRALTASEVADLHAEELSHHQ